MSDEHFQQLYAELRKIAASKLKAEKPGQTLNATALVHEAWLKLNNVSSDWNDRTHFFRGASTAMRQILVDRARAKLTTKRAAGKRVQMEDHPESLKDEQFLALDEALDALALEKPEHAKLVELRFIMNMSGDEAAEVMGISPSTADRMWRYAKAWLQVRLREGNDAV